MVSSPDGTKKLEPTRIKLEDKRVSEIVSIPIEFLVHPEGARNWREIDSDFVKLLEDAIIQNPFGFTSPLGVNAPDNIDFENFDWEEMENWTTLGEKLEVFGGNHLMEASKRVVTSGQLTNSKAENYVKFRPCIVYQNLTDDEMLQVYFIYIFITL